MRAAPIVPIALMALTAACSRATPPGPAASNAAAPPAPATPATPPPAPLPAHPHPGDEGPVRALPATVMPQPERVVAIGDVHGDVEAARAALRLAGVLGADDHWSGGHTVAVQTGDALDRGDTERGILELFRRLRDEAERAGGAFVALNGNHEVMNVQGDFRYVTPGGYTGFADYGDMLRGHAAAQELPERARGRVAAFMPGGPWARHLAEQNTVVVVGDTVFVHGGLLPEHVVYGLPAINRAVRAFMLGEAPLPAAVDGEQSPFWLRRFSLADDPETCALLDQTLARVPARRMVVGHTVQEHGITSACGGKVWRIDVGLSRAYGGPVQALEIRGGQARVLGGGGGGP